MRDINVIVIHHSGNHDSYEKIKELHVHEYGWDDVGCHYMVSRDGEIIDGRPVFKVGAHVKGFNSDSIGIDILGNLDLEEVTPVQFQALVSLVKGLMRKYDVKIVKGHNEFSGVVKTCPGLKFDMDKFRAALSSTLRC